MYRPIESDPRWTITQEYTGKAKPQFVVRFCDDWVGSRAYFDSAVLFAVCERGRRNRDISIEAMERG